ARRVDAALHLGAAAGGNPRATRLRSAGVEPMAPVPAARRGRWRGHVGAEPAARDQAPGMCGRGERAGRRRREQRVPRRGADHVRPGSGAVARAAGHARRHAARRDPPGPHPRAGDRRFTLTSVDHAPGTEAVAVENGSVYVGARRPALRVTDAAGVDLTLAATGGAGEPLYADSGATLDVTLPPNAAGPQDVLVLQSGFGSIGRAGIAVDAAAGAGRWSALTTLHPRSGWTTQATLLRGATLVRLRLRDAVAIWFIGRLSPAAYANARGATLLSARTASG